MVSLPPVFAFDLDGTITTREILPVLARELGLVQEMALLTHLTLNGTLDFVSSFRLRFSILRSIPVKRVQEIVAEIPLDPHIADFIQERKDDCAILSGNLDCWVAPLVGRLGCRAYLSRSRTENGLLCLDSILDKGDAVRDLMRSKRKVVAIGESANDLPMFELAHVSVAFAGVHEPLPEILRRADHVAENGRDLCDLLKNLSSGL